jgi:glycosyltransferase involved in cell wall biosynthesis
LKQTRRKKIFIMSRCAWTLFSFRSGLIKKLCDSGYEVIAGGSGADGYGKQVETLGCRFVDLPISAQALNPWFDLKLLASIWKTYRRERPDVVHHFTIKPVIYGSLAARFSGVPRVVNTITGLGYAFTDAGFLVNRAARLLYKIALRGSDVTFFQNGDDHDLFVSLGLVDAERAAVVAGSGVDIDRFKPLPRPSSDRQAVVFLFIGRLLHHKGIVEYLEAAKLVSSRVEDARFEVLGEPDERNPTCLSEAEINAYVDAGIVTWRRKQDDVRQILAAADVVVLPSYREGTPRVLLEAGAMGKPVITSNAVGCRDVVDNGETGLIVPVRDVGALAEAMERLFSSASDRERMGAAGREKIVRYYDEKSVLEASLQAYGQ